MSFNMLLFTQVKGERINLRNLFGIVISALILIIVPVLVSELISTFILADNIQVVSYVIVSLQLSMLVILYYQNK